MLVQEVERSSHRLEAAASSTDPELRKAIEEAERRRQAFEMPTNIGGRPSSPPHPPPLLPDEGTGLATVNSTVNEIISPPQSSRIALVLGAAIAFVGVAALILAFVITRSPPPPAAAVTTQPAPPAAADAGAVEAKPIEPTPPPVVSSPPVVAKKPPVVRPQPQPVAKKPKPNCDPPYDVDAQGGKHFKEECLKN